MHRPLSGAPALPSGAHATVHARVRPQVPARHRGPAGRRRHPRGARHLGLGFPGGYVGVDVFFVISGFLITRQLMDEFARTEHASRSRVSTPGGCGGSCPPPPCVIVGTMLACWKWDSPLQVQSDALDGLFSAFSGINWRLARNGTNYFAVGAPPSPFQHFWSLAVEEQFYVVWPALLLTVGAARGPPLRTAGSRWCGRCWPSWRSRWCLTATTTVSSPSWAYFGTQTRAWELAFGALIAVTVDVWTRMPPASRRQMSWLGLGMIALSALRSAVGTVYPGTAVMLPVTGSALVIAGGCPGWSRSGELLLKRRPFQFVGTGVATRGISPTGRSSSSCRWPSATR